jgi:NAD(P) transhydrogenase subunit alpha
MRIGVPKETWPGELRAALVPAGVKKLVGLGFSINVEAGLGAGARIPDDEYRAVGANVVADSRAAVAGADVVVRVRKPADADVADLASGVIHISFLDPFNEKSLVANLASRGITGISMEMVPRSTLRAEDGRAVVAGEPGRLRHRDSGRHVGRRCCRCDGRPAPFSRVACS